MSTNKTIGYSKQAANIAAEDIWCLLTDKYHLLRTPPTDNDVGLKKMNRKQMLKQRLKDVIHEIFQEDSC